MKGLFFIEAPFQLLGAFEAIKIYHIEKYKIVIRLNGTNNDIQLINTINELFSDQREIDYIVVKSQKLSFINYLGIIKLMLVVSVLHLQYDYCFLGNYESKFLKLITFFMPKNKFILLDDGIKTITIQDKFTDGYHCNVLTMLYKLKPLSNQIVKYHTFDRLKLLYSKNSTIQHSNREIFFLGSKLTETFCLEEGVYLEIVKSILRKFKGFTIVYFPHRNEETKKLNILLLEFNNLRIQTIDCPIELHIVRSGLLPQRVVSLYSAALLSIKLIYPDMKVNSILFDYSKSKYAKHLLLVYKSLEDYDIKALEIN